MPDSSQAEARCSISVDELIRISTQETKNEINPAKLPATEIKQAK